MEHDEQPWRGPGWAVSQHDFEPAIAVEPRPVQLHDLTIRDGEESADLAFTTAQKVRIVESLARIGIRRTEVFLTVPGWQEVVRAILARDLDLDLWVTWQPGRVERALDLGARHVMIWYPVGDMFQRHVLGDSREALMARMLEQVRTARAAGATANLFLQESTRAELGHILAAATAAEAEGASAVTLVDSQGIARPNAMGWLVRELKAGCGLEVEVHCHNDFGLAVANVLAAYEAGAEVLQASINGVGYRAGNAALEAVATALRMLYGVDTGIELDRLPEVCRQVEEMSGIPTGYYAPIVGKGAFRYEQWAAAAALIEAGERPYAFPFEPEVVGRSPELVIGKWSDEGAVVEKLAGYGLTAEADAVPRILVRCQRAAVAAGRPLSDAEVIVIAEDEGASEA